MRLSIFIRFSASALQAESFGRQPATAFEETGKIRRLGKTQAVRHLIDGHGGVHQAALGFQQQALVNQLQGGLPGQASAQSVEGRGASAGSRANERRPTHTSKALISDCSISSRPGCWVLYSSAMESNRASRYRRCSPA